MSILISGICGFVGSTLACTLAESQNGAKIFGFDNFSRPGSHLNYDRLSAKGIKVFHADARQPSDIEQLPGADWVIDAAANPSVLAGCDGVSSTRQVIENNLYGTVNLLEYAAKHRAGFVLLSSSRVYSIQALRDLPLNTVERAFALVQGAELGCTGVDSRGISEQFSTAAPISIYGSTKLSSEIIALEYADRYGIPVLINRCGVLAGAGQFGRPDQGIFAFWINAYRARRHLRYIGFGGSGYQVRDCFHPVDLARLLESQMQSAQAAKANVCNVGGGIENAISLRQLSDWCADRFGAHEVVAELEERQLDVPWIVMNSAAAEANWNFQISIPLPEILEEIATHAEQNPDWLRISLS